MYFLWGRALLTNSDACPLEELSCSATFFGEDNGGHTRLSEGKFWRWG
jgi:hypothetical protein